MRRSAPDSAPAASGPNGRVGDRSGPVDLPEIVPATPDDADDRDAPAAHTGRNESSTETGAARQGRVGRDGRHLPDRRASAALVERDATESWVEEAPPPVVVASPGQPQQALRVRGRRPRVRKVTRTVRHLDPWSVFKVALVFALCLYGVLLTSGVLLWNVATATGTVTNVERWFTQFGWETFELDGGEIFRNAWVAGLFGAVALTGAAVLVATLFNLVSDMVGGVRLTVLEEEVVERTTGPSRRYVVRRPPTAAGDDVVGSATDPTGSSATAHQSSAHPAGAVSTPPRQRVRSSGSSATRPGTG